jgi:crotonobetainyl-CoA:carnitine CoA-transferase CaiB-like acyl-CoA transferase
MPALPALSALRPVLKGVRVVSLALNLPGPAALMRLRAMGARCLKIEPPPPAGANPGAGGDPMSHYEPQAYQDLHRGIRTLSLDLKSAAGQRQLHRHLAQADVLLTSFRPSALRKLGLDWTSLHAQHPALSLVTIVGAPGAQAEEPGHDLTYLASCDLVNGHDLPPTLYADMGGSLLTTEAVLQCLLARQQPGRRHGQGLHHEVALSDAAAYLALPRHWGLTSPKGMVGGAHAGYRVYACRNGRVAVAALEPHFAARLCQAAGLSPSAAQDMTRQPVHAALAGFFATRTRRQLDTLAQLHDIPLHTLP